MRFPGWGAVGSGCNQCRLAIVLTRVSIFGKTAVVNPVWVQGRWSWMGYWMLYCTERTDLLPCLALKTFSNWWSPLQATRAAAMIHELGRETEKAKTRDGERSWLPAPPEERFWPPSDDSPPTIWGLTYLSGISIIRIELVRDKGATCAHTPTVMRRVGVVGGRGSVCWSPARACLICRLASRPGTAISHET